MPPVHLHYNRQHAMTDEIEVLTASSVDKVGMDAWDVLSNGRRLQSTRMAAS
jgi:hypothetical protein